MRHWIVNGPTIFDNADNYEGKDLSSLLVVPVSRARDSGPLDESNFEEALRLLGGESATVQVHRFGHWACGWYELLLVDPADAVAVKVGGEIESRLEDYPVLDEEDFSQREWNEAEESWGFLSLADRIDLCNRVGVSIFAARRQEMPGEAWEELRPE